MSIRDVIEDIESGNWQKRYRPEVIETAREVEKYFEDLRDAVEYVSLYESFYDDEESMDDPAGYAESWYEEFGTVEGIKDSLKGDP
jgi:hypothetical protein